MEHTDSLEKALYFTKLSVHLACTWPPSLLATKWEAMKHEIAWILMFISILCLFLPLLPALYIYKSNADVFLQSCCSIIVSMNYIVKAIIYKRHQKGNQIIIYEMERFLNEAQDYERSVLKGYLDRCSLFHVFLTFMNYFTTFAMIGGPLIFPQPLPTHAVYPFSVESGIVKYLVYIHQSFTGLQLSSMLSSDCQIALMMWFAGARFEILAGELEIVTSVIEFQNFVRKHQRILAYAQDISGTMCYTALTSTALSGLGTIMVCILIVGDQPIAIKLQYTPIIFIGLLNLFVCAWPAENLLRVCYLVGDAAYNAGWQNHSSSFMKDILVVIRRCQQPVIVSVGGFLPQLSFQFYANFLSAAFSYFTTLRVAMTTNDNN